MSVETFNTLGTIISFLGIFISFYFFSFILYFAFHLKIHKFKTIFLLSVLVFSLLFLIVLIYRTTINKYLIIQLGHPLLAIPILIAIAIFIHKKRVKNVNS